MAIIEDFNVHNPDLQPWDPRIKKIAMMDFPSHEYGGYLDAQQFIVYLHCQRKIGWAITTDLVMQIPVATIMNIMRDEMQPLIDGEYKKLQEMAGGSVDIYGNAIKTIDTSFSLIHNDGKLEGVSTGLITAQLSEEEQYQVWCKQASNHNNGKQEGFVYVGKPGDYEWKQVGWTAEGFISKQEPTSTGMVVQQNLKKLFPALMEIVNCPVCGRLNNKHKQMSLDRMIIHLNDEHQWTREQVADWLESLDIDLGMKENV